MNGGKTTTVGAVKKECPHGKGHISVIIRQVGTFISIPGFKYTIEGPQWSSPQKGTVPDGDGYRVNDVKAGEYKVTIDPGDLIKKYSPKDTVKKLKVEHKNDTTFLFFVNPKAGLSISVIDKSDGGKAIPCKSITAKHKVNGKEYKKQGPLPGGKADFNTGFAGDYEVTIALEQEQIEKYGDPVKVTAHVNLGALTPVKIELEPKRKVTIKSVSDHFAPSKEKLKIEYSITALAKDDVFLRIYGTKKPGDPPELVYEVPLTPDDKKNGDHVLETWDGACNKSSLDGKFLNPLYSPYKVTFYYSDTVKAEKEFKILYHSIKIRKGPWVPGTAPVKADGKKWAQYRLNEMGYFGGPVGNDTEDYFKKGIMRFKYNNDKLRKDSFPDYDDTIPADVLDELENDAHKRQWLTEDAFNDQSKISRINLEMIYYQEYDVGASHTDEFSKKKWDMDPKRINRPLIPLEADILILSRDKAEGVDAPGAVGPVRINWKVEDVEESLSAQYVPTAKSPSRIKAYLSEGLKFKSGRTGVGDNAPVEAKGIRGADTYATAFLNGTFYEPYDVKKDTANKVVYCTACIDKTAYPDREGKAGIYFRPSIIAGDAYRVSAEIDFSDHDNKVNLENFHKCTDVAKRIQVKTGVFRIWRTDKVALVIDWPKTMAGVSGFPKLFTEKDKKALCEEYSKAWIDIDFKDADFKEISDIIDETAYKDLVNAKTGIDKAKIKLKNECIVGTSIPDQEPDQTGTEYKALIDTKTKTDYFAKIKNDLIDLILKKVRKEYPSGVIFINFLLHEPKKVSFPNPKKPVKTENHYMTSASSTGCKDGYVYLFQGDSDAMYYVAAHEMGHLYFLKHWEYASGTKDKEHDKADHNCIMSYTTSKAPAHQQPGIYLPHFCGKCNLHLRGWDVTAAGMPERSDDETKLADPEITLTIDDNEPEPGTEFKSAMTVKNKGPEKLTGFELKVDVPADFTFVAIDGTAPANTTYDNATHIWKITELVKDATKTLVLKWKPADAAASKDYYFACYPKKQNENYSSPSVEFAKSKWIFVKGVRLEALIGDPSAVKPATGEVTTVKFTLKNNASADTDDANDSIKAQGLKFTVTAEAGLDMDSAVAAKGTFDKTTGVWNIGDLDVGASTTLDVKIKPALASADKTLKVSGEVTASTQKDGWGKKYWKTTEKEIKVKKQCELVLSISTDVTEPIKKDTEFGITAKVKNNGPHAATNIAVSVPFNAKIQVVSSTPGVGTYAGGTWRIDTLAKNAEASLTLRAKIIPKCKSNNESATIEVQSVNEGDTGRGTASWRKAATVDIKGGCFLSTACTKSMGRDDNCGELAILRRFRDTYMSKPEMYRYVDEYYMTAPEIVSAIERLPEARRVWSEIYERLILPCVKLIEHGENREAFLRYRSYTDMLKRKFLTAKVPDRAHCTDGERL